MSRFASTDPRRRQPWRPHLTEAERQRLAVLDQKLDGAKHAKKERAELINKVARRVHQARIEKRAKEAQ